MKQALLTLPRLRLIAIGAFAALIASQAGAQAGFPTLQGSPQRPGHNSDPINYNSGQSLLQWFVPTGNLATTTEVVDNTDLGAANTVGFPNGPYPNNANGFATAAPSASVPGIFPENGVWQFPPSPTFEAAGAFFESVSANNSNLRVPDYYYTPCVASTQGGGPTSGATASFSWNFQPLLNAGSSFAALMLPGGAGVTPTAGFATDTANAGFQGPYYYKSATANVAVNPTAYTNFVTYAPGAALANGTYTVWAYIPGNGGGETYGSAVEYKILYGTTVTFTGYLNEQIAANGGWVELGAGGYQQGNANGALSVVITNGDANAAEVTAGDTAYADAVKFVGNGSPFSYALYVWLPIGATDTTANDTTGTGTFVYPQRYFAYQITYGNGQTYIDVVDTYLAGFGWVRLGNGGLPTNVVFPSDGVDDIQITLLNTVPRDQNGNLLIPAGSTPGQFLVYADAAKAQPVLGTFAAAPVSDYLRDATGNPLVDAGGDPDVAPTANGTAYFFRILAAQNNFTPTTQSGNLSVVQQGQVTCYQGNPYRWAQPPVNNGTGITATGTPTALWTFSPSAASPYANVLTPGSAEVTPTAGFVTDTTNPNFQGPNYYKSPLVNVSAGAAFTDEVTYAPGAALADGLYTIYAYIPGNGGGETYGSAVEYQIWQGKPGGPGSILAFTGFLNEQTASGWVQLGTAQFAQSNLTAPLNVVITNGDNVPADVTAGDTAYADAVKFVGAANLTVTSTPVIAQVNIVQPGGTTTKFTQVAIVPDETGKIHCLDYTGNSDGTTTEYWSYPSTPDPLNANWTDPNLNGIDGPAGSTVPTAQMPTGFNLSSAVVTPVPGQTNVDGSQQYRLYIASTNGRVYCIDMAGRGDWSVPDNAPGSTQRFWSFPNDYPSVPVVASHLGAFRGSVLYSDQNDVADGLTKPTVFVAAPQGRVYSLDGVGTIANRTTAVNWAFPAVSSPTLPPIVMTPSLAFGNLYFGTLHDQNTEAPATFFALNAGSGAITWADTTDNAGELANAVNATVLTSLANDPNQAVMTDFVAGPVTVPLADLAEAGVTGQVNSVYVLNQNGYIYGFNAGTGAPLTFTDGLGGIHYYIDNELGVTSTASLGFQVMKVFGATFTQVNSPTILVPTSEGHIYGLFANLADLNSFSIQGAGGTTNLLSYGYGLTGQTVNPAAFSNQRMIVNDDAGLMYIFDQNNFGGLDTAGNAPATSVSPPNAPGPADAFRYLHVKFLSENSYNLLKQVTAGSTQGGMPYATAIADTGPTYPGKTNNVQDFEYGQYAYILVYGFPYATTDPSSTPANQAIPAPIVNIRISGAGRVIRQFQVDTRQFNAPTASPQLYAPKPGDSATFTTNGWVQDGYAVLAFPFSDSGPNSIPPGTENITADVTTAAISTNSASQEIAASPMPTTSALNPPLPTGTGSDPGTLTFQMANPLALKMLGPSVGQATLADAALGVSAATDQQALINGNLLGTFPLLTQSTGFTSDGTQATGTFSLIDRSLMVMLHGDGSGIGSVRFDRTGLGWQGGATTIYNPLLPGLYPGFEDTPINAPNTSLDYPDITPDAVTFAVNPNGTAQNPLLTPVFLNAPTSGGAQITEADAGNPNGVLATRTLNGTPVNVNVNVLKHQPGVNIGALAAGGNPDNLFAGTQVDEANNVEPQGYYGLSHIFVDSGQTGTFALGDSYRMYHIASGVTPDWKIQVDTPTLDLGALPTGLGYGTGSPYLQSAAPGAPGAYDPWSGLSGWNRFYQPFDILNDGNINNLNMRIAKGSNINTGGLILPWQIGSDANDPQAWMDGSFDLWSNIDSHWAMPNPNSAGTNAVIAQKPRVTDLVPRPLNVNPTPRLNFNIPSTAPGGATSGPLNPDIADYPPGQPKIAVSVPFGFPAGTYSTTVNAIEDTLFPVGGNPTASTTGNGQFPEVWDPLTGLNAVEPYSQPGLPLSFTVRESRVTNTSTPGTATMADNLLPLSDPSKSWVNMTPGGMRDARGSIVAAWASDRPTFAPVATTLPSGLPATHIYLASVANSANFNVQTNSGVTVGVTDPITGANPVSPLKDLDFFTPASGTNWFAPQNGGNPFPNNPLFPLNANETLIAGTDSYAYPSFPLGGERDPYWQVDGNQFFQSTHMAFTGSAQVTTSSGRLDESQVFLSTVSTASGGGVTLGSPVALDPDPLSIKGKPSVVETANGAFVFYPTTTGNQTSIKATSSAGGQPLVLNFGNGFESVDEPSAYGRAYLGGNANLPKTIIDLTFTGKLRGRPNSEIYLGRLAVSGLTLANNGTFVDLAPQVLERVINEGNGVYRARGVEWDRTGQVFIQDWGSGSGVDLVDYTTKAVDRESGLISYDSRLGGKVFVDPDLGTIRFTHGAPAQSAEIRVTYTPAFLRVTTGGPEACTSPTGLFDDHYISDPTGWSATSGVQDSRYLFFYGKAAGSGQTSRPYMETMRLGVRLPYKIATQNGGAPVALTVTGNTGPYQMDAANGRLYFTAVDEDRPINVTYTADTGAGATSLTLTGLNVSFVLEKGETPVLIGEAANEGSLNAFLDPFTYANSPRPPLVWMFYTSTRAGGPDIYFQTIAPRLAPVVATGG